MAPGWPAWPTTARSARPSAVTSSAKNWSYAWRYSTDSRPSAYWYRARYLSPKLLLAYPTASWVPWGRKLRRARAATSVDSPSASSATCQAPSSPASSTARCTFLPLPSAVYSTATSSWPSPSRSPICMGSISSPPRGYFSCGVSPRKEDSALCTALCSWPVCGARSSSSTLLPSRGEALHPLSTRASRAAKSAWARRFFLSMPVPLLPLSAPV